MTEWRQHNRSGTTPLAGGAAPVPNCHHLGLDNAGNCISRRAGADETCCGQILLARCSLLSENFIFPQGSHECHGWIQIRFFFFFPLHILSVCGPPRAEEREVIHSAETHQTNPISSLPQQEIITSVKAVGTGVKALSPNCAAGPACSYRPRARISAGTTQAKLLFKTKNVC